MKKMAIIFAVMITSLVIAASAVASSTGSWTYTYPVNDLATFTGTCYYADSGAFRCEGTQVSGPAVTSAFDNRSGDCKTSIKPATDSRPATAKLVCHA